MIDRLVKLKENSSDLSRVFSSPKISSIEAQAFYYSSWIPSAIHISCAIKQFSNIGSIAEKLKLPPQTVSLTLMSLKELGLIHESNGKFSITEDFLHISKDSFLVTAHHSNWRNQAILDCQKRNPSSLHFTGVFATGTLEFDKLKEQIQLTLERTKSIVKSTTREEELVCISADAFKIA